MNSKNHSAQKGLFHRLKAGLSKTQSYFGQNLERLLRKKKIDQEFIQDLEEVLITADIGFKSAMDLIDRVQGELTRRQLTDSTAVQGQLKEEIYKILREQERPLEISDTFPFVIMVIGVNGSGKTTTIAKMARKIKHEGRSVLLVAADTFRAAAIEQLEIWGRRVGTDVIKQRQGGDPSAVVYDGLHAAKARNLDTVIIDTAGRLHTKANLMEELKKVCRVANRVVPGAPHEILLVLDATTGQNGLAQARLFHEALGVTGIAVTKMDGTSRGGILVAISRELMIPLRYIGIGEAMDDLIEFDARAFVDAIL
ncbi:MAG: signal recognition particle-docking protein FtsY [Deltaproteobacteria bacterium]|nr:signal recognition particle-docking protein FtsY [Deltaproteobacteria bacterium]MBW2307545.1 signal recognition particle-docking protein FtsY [Deltaproteobacteria bacterium]